MILTPAYGRDYKSAKAATEAYLSGLDWQVASVDSKWCGSYCSCRDFPNQPVTLKYNKLTRATLTTYRPETSK